MQHQDAQFYKSKKQYKVFLNSKNIKMKTKFVKTKEDKLFKNKDFVK